VEGLKDQESGHWHKACTQRKVQDHGGWIKAKDGCLTEQQNACDSQQQKPRLLAMWCLILVWWPILHQCHLLGSAFGRRLWIGFRLAGTKILGTCRYEGFSILSLWEEKEEVPCILGLAFLLLLLLLLGLHPLMGFLCSEW